LLVWFGMGHPPDELVNQIAERHHGVFTGEDLRAVGVSAHVRKHRLAVGRWIAIHDGVYRIGGIPLTWRGRVLAACFAADEDSVASHRSAAELWQLPGRATGVVEVTCRRWRRTREPGVVVHESLMLDDVDRALVDGIPVTTATRTLFDLAGRSNGDQVLDLAIENALRRKLTTVPELVAAQERLARRGRPGSAAFRAALDRRAADDALTESEAERLIVRLLVVQGLPTPALQHEIRDHDGRLVARVDLAYPDLRIAIEYDSYTHHVSREALVRDSARRNSVVALGWLPITATAADLRNGGHRLATDVRRARALRTGVTSAE
jgi:predicted transcriptional regulator of viral defense system